MPFPSHWPTLKEVHEANMAAGGMREPFPHDLSVMHTFKQPDETYREEIRTYRITRKRTPEEELGENPFEMVAIEIGRTLRLACEGETPEHTIYNVTDFSETRLVLLEPKVDF